MASCDIKHYKAVIADPAKTYTVVVLAFLEIKMDGYCFIGCETFPRLSNNIDN